ncbi:MULTISPECIES: hypothetical protein [Shewanella]|uniref:hypothetical protein n=1 Tax=Shewanella TaxID=22 RepID=UPI00048D0733|nr:MULTISPECIES: hypothetical protein [Shewanella]QLE85602.1 hypothetical protein FLM48_11255 [Shewanella sp. Scap07]
MLQDNYDLAIDSTILNSVSEQARAYNATQSRAQELKSMISNHAKLTFNLLVPQTDLGPSEKHKKLLACKSEGLELYRFVITANLQYQEESILLSYIDNNLSAIEDGMTTMN